jgi:hypothetical protein
MLRTVFTLVALRRASKLVAGSQAHAQNWGTVITSAFTAGDVITSAAAGVAALGLLAVGLKLGPNWAFKMVRKLTGSLR